MITVFTPSYNRAYILPDLYQSLLSQTCGDFEWLVIDDGSVDNTEELMRSFIDDKRLNIRYFKRKNGGKHRAINQAVQMSFGEWFFIVDSDDRLPSDSVEIVIKRINSIEENSLYAGVAGSKCYPNGNKVGGEVSYDVLDTDSVTFRERFCIKGDMAEVWRTSVLREFPFPEFEGEKFISECVVWNLIAEKYQLHYFNQHIYTCDYLQDGLTKNIRHHHRQSPRGSMLECSMIMHDSRFRFSSRLKSAINYWRYSIGGNDIYHGEFPVTWWGKIVYPVGLFFYYRDLKK